VTSTHLTWAPWAIGVFVLLLVIGAAAAYWNVKRFPARRQFTIAAASAVIVGLLLGAAAVFGVTLMVQQDTKPPLSIGDGSSILNRVEYGDRS
jgi:peptidoglycan/LPS O-acetylase OafA/YrhL